MILDAQGWCTGMTQRDGTGREVGGGFRMGNTCTPVAYSCLCMSKPIQYCKINKKRKLWYIYTMDYYSAIKKYTFESVLMRWMKLQPIIQSDVNQKEKHQYSILMHIDRI